MYAVRLHGRGGQGIVTTAELLAVAAFEEGLHAQAFPTFGSERTGAPVAAFCRLDTVAVRTHEPITTPDALIVADLGLFGQVDVLAGLRPGGCLVVNAPPGAPLPQPMPDDVTVVPVDATGAGVRHLGRPVPGAALLGTFAATTGRIGLPALIRAIESRFPGVLGRGNVEAAREAYLQVSAVDARANRTELADAQAD
jgi:pyruvate ferredoxin oxidoreductase gamma subunit